MITKAKILNAGDQTAHFAYAIGDGHPMGYSNLLDVRVGSRYQDLLNKGHYVKTGNAHVEGDWTLIGGETDSPKAPVIPLDGEDFILGKKVSELQQDVVVGHDDKVYGILHNTKNYKGYSDSEVEGNYFAFYVPIPEGCTATVKKGENAPVSLDDGLVVLKITDTGVNVVVTITDAEENSITRTLALSELVCE